MKIYKTKTKHILANSTLLLLPLALTIVTFTEGEAVTQGEWIGLSIFWALSLVIVFSPLGAKIEIGDDYVTHHFLGLKRRLLSSNVEVLEYGKLFRGGLGYGKGLKIWERTPKGRKYYSIGEKAFGKEALEHAKRVLEARH